MTIRRVIIPEPMPKRRGPRANPKDMRRVEIPPSKWDGPARSRADGPKPSNSPEHFMSSVDEEAMTGECSTCGTVSIARLNAGGRLIWVCRNQEVEKRRARKKRAKANRLVRTRAALIEAGKNGVPATCTCRYQDPDPDCPFDARLTPDMAQGHPGFRDESRA